MHGKVILASDEAAICKAHVMHWWTCFLLPGACCLWRCWDQQLGHRGVTSSQSLKNVVMCSHRARKSSMQLVAHWGAFGQGCHGNRQGFAGTRRSKCGKEARQDELAPYPQCMHMQFYGICLWTCWQGCCQTSQLRGSKQTMGTRVWLLPVLLLGVSGQLTPVPQPQLCPSNLGSFLTGAQDDITSRTSNPLNCFRVTLLDPSASASSPTSTITTPTTAGSPASQSVKLSAPASQSVHLLAPALAPALARLSAPAPAPESVHLSAPASRSVQLSAPASASRSIKLSGPVLPGNSNTVVVQGPPYTGPLTPGVTWRFYATVQPEKGNNNDLLWSSFLGNQTHALLVVRAVAWNVSEQTMALGVNISCFVPSWASTGHDRQLIGSMQLDVLVQRVTFPSVTAQVALSRAFSSFREQIGDVQVSVGSVTTTTFAPASPVPSLLPFPTSHPPPHSPPPRVTTARHHSPSPPRIPGPSHLAPPQPGASSPAPESFQTPTPGPKLGPGAIIGIACAASLLAIIAAAGGVYKLKQYRQGGSKALRSVYQICLKDELESIVHNGTTALDKAGQASSAAPSTWETLVRQLREGEPFLHGTARCYPWTTSASLTGPCQAVEAGVNDILLDRLMHGQEVAASTACPAIQLTKTEFTSQVQLLADGLLGRGGSALVFKCIWPSRFGPNALLAAKVLKDGVEANMLELQSFTYEANLLSGIQHPHVVKLYGYCLEPPTVCLILELLPVSLKCLLYNIPSHKPDNLALIAQHSSGTVLETPCASTALCSTTTSEINQAGQPSGHVPSQARTSTQQLVTLMSTDQHAARPLTVVEVVHISKQLASGLAYLHSRELPAAKDEVSVHIRSGAKGVSIVHRDLKPANILLNSQGSAKITDFGLARRHEQTTIATVHVGAGTLAYMAPELLVAARVGTDHAVTNRVDIYSLGLMIWEMLAGEAPWHGLTETAILAAVINRRRPALAGNDIDREHVTLQRDDHPQTPAASFSLRHQEAGLSQLNNIIMSCWHHRELRRPAASAVLGMLTALEEQFDNLQQ